MSVAVALLGLFLKYHIDVPFLSVTIYYDPLGQFHAMQKAGCYYVTVIEDTRKNAIIGAATLVTELKIIHGCGVRGRLEDVVVNTTYRGKQLGKL